MNKATNDKITLDVFCPAVNHRVQLAVSKQCTIAEVKKWACNELFVLEDEVEFWDVWNGMQYACLESRLHDTVSAARLMDKQSIVLKERQGCTLSPTVLLLSNAWSKPPDMLLVFDDGTQLPAHRCILELSSPLLQDVFAQGMANISCRQAWQHANNVSNRPESPPTPTYKPDELNKYIPATEAKAVPASYHQASTMQAQAHHSLQNSLNKLPEAAQDNDMFVLRVPSDEWYSWVYCLHLLYPCCQMRRPPVTWANIRRLMVLADKWMITPVLQVCQEFLLLPSSQLSADASSQAYVWWWLTTADRLNMPAVVRKCIAFIQVNNVSGNEQRQAMQAAVKDVVACCRPDTVAQLLTAVCVYKDQLLS